MYNPPSNPLVYDISAWDNLQWEDYLDKHGDATNAIALGTKKIFSFPTFASEVFHRLYTPEPKPIETPKPEAKWAIEAHQQLTNCGEFDDLATTIAVEAATDSFKKWLLSGVGAAKFSEEIAQWLPAPPSRLANPQPLREQILAAKRRLKQLLDSGQQQQDNSQSQGSQQLQAQIEDLQQQIDEITLEGKKAVTSAQNYAKRLETQLGEAIAAATFEATQAVSDAAAALSAFGWGEGLGNASIGNSMSQKVALANRVAKNQKLVRIAQLAGRMKLMAQKKQRTKTTEIGTQIYSVETGNNLSRLVPSELVKLAVPQLHNVFIKDYCEKALLQYQLQSKEKLSKGPIVVCLDSSGSMTGAPEEWSKAVAIALLTIANQQKRTCRILHFTEDVVKVDDFPGGKLDPNKLISSMEVFYGGGTSWEAPLSSALEIIQSEKQFLKADIILITDGECNVSSHWLTQFQEKQKELEFCTFGVMLGNSTPQRLSQILDTTIAIPNLNADGEIETIFGI